MSDLFTASKPHDLPPKWDGQPIEWGEWHFREVFLCPPPKKPSCCPKCGSTKFQPEAIGVYRQGRIAYGGVVDLHRGRPGSRRKLVAKRCPDCRHDQVLDPYSRDAWDLDPDDYLDEGSFA